MPLETDDANVAENWLAAIIESSDDAIVSKTLDGFIATWNAAAERLFGYTGPEAMGRPVTMLAPAGRRDEMPDLLVRIRRGEPVDAYETRRRHKDGRIIDVLLRVTPIRNGSGKVVGASKVVRDISDRIAAERRQRRLSDELNHRVKNTLMTIQSMATQTLRHTPDPAAFRQAFEARLVAVSRAHDLLEAGRWESVELRELIARNLASFADRACITMGGPMIRLGPEATVTLALAFNELTLNAIVSGALSRPEGRLSVTWEIRACGDGGEPRLHLDWIERGVRMRAEPTRRGFGRRFLEDGMCRQLQGDVTLAFEPEGVRCRFDLLLTALQSSAFAP